jgi:hypothetical protein
VQQIADKTVTAGKISTQKADSGFVLKSDGVDVYCSSAGGTREANSRGLLVNSAPATPAAQSLKFNQTGYDSGQGLLVRCYSIE